MRSLPSEGYVFIGVCLSTGGCLVPEGAWSQGGCLVGGGVWSGGGGLVSQHVLRQTIPGRDGYYCGQYTSYWNAFLFLVNVHTFAMIFHLKTKQECIPVGCVPPTH